MLFSALFAFLHHLAAFALVAMLAIELILLRGELTLERARQLLRVDVIYGATAGLLLLVGLTRVFFFEKGAAFYLHSAPFIAKMVIFLCVGLLSIYPTIELLSWRRALQQNQLPAIDTQKISRLRRIVHFELFGVVLILLCAALAARGIGFLGNSAMRPI